MNTIVLLTFVACFLQIHGSVIQRTKRQNGVITRGATGVDPDFLASLLNQAPAPPELINTGSANNVNQVGGVIVAETRRPQPPAPTTPATTTKKPKKPRTRKPKRTTRKPKRTTTTTTTATTPEPVETTEFVIAQTTTYNIPETTSIFEETTEFQEVTTTFKPDTTAEFKEDTTTFKPETTRTDDPRTEAPESTDFGFEEFGTTDESPFQPTEDGGFIEEIGAGEGTGESKTKFPVGGATKFGPVAPPEGDGTDPGIIPLLPEVTGGTNAEFFGIDAGTKKGFANGQGGKSAGAGIPGLGFFGGSKGGGLQGCGKVGGGKSVGIGKFGFVNKGTSVDLSPIPGIGKVLGRC